MPTTRIRIAIQDCLNRCRKSDAPLARLSLFCNELRVREWTEQDIRTVETSVVRFLAALSDSDIPTVPD
jgi:hypothetical protein